MKRTVVVAAAAVALMMGLGAWSVQSRASDEGKTFTLEGRQAGFHVVDAAPTGDSAGDLGTLAGELSRNGTRVGKYQGYCVQLDADGHSECQFTLVLPAGQIVLASGFGPGINGDAVTHEPIVGGTGDYAKARGYAEGRETGEDTIEYRVHLAS